MKTSVIIPTLNADRFLAEALDSVAAQTRAPDEVLVVDGGSSDDTLAIARRYPFVRCVAQEGRGLADGWNSGVRAACGDLLTFLDSDDIWLPEKIERQLACLAAEPETQVVFGRVQFFLSPGESRPAGFKPSLFEGTHSAPMPGTLLLRREAFERVGWFDPTMRVASDIAWFARLRQLQLPTRTLPDLMIRKRVHSGNLSLTSAQSSVYVRELLQVLRNTQRRPDALTATAATAAAAAFPSQS